LLELGNLQQALEVANRAVSLSPDQPWGYQIKALTLLRMRRKKQALEPARAAARVAPEDPGLLHILALTESANGHGGDARKVARRLLELQPDQALAYVTCAGIELDAQKWKLAEQWGREALKRDPENLQAMNIVGRSLLRQGESKAAMEWLGRAARSNADDPFTVGSLRYFAIWTRLKHYRWWAILTFLCIFLVLRAPIWEGKVLWIALLGLVGMVITVITQRKQRSIAPSQREYFDQTQMTKRVRPALLAFIVAIVVVVVMPFAIVGGRQLLQDHSEVIYWFTLGAAILTMGAAMVVLMSGKELLIAVSRRKQLPGAPPAP
jgi:tetratricopeptide (TPR) repeat protein